MVIVSWNMQGGTNAAYLNQVIQRTGANVLCLQETGNLTALLQGPAPIAGFPGSLTGNFAAGQGFFECVFWFNTGWTQGGLAVMSNVTNVGPASRGILAAAAAPYNPAIPRNLPWMVATNPAGGPDLQIYSVHSPPAWAPVTVANVCSWSNAQVTNVNGLAPNWAIVGDFNAPPTAPGFAAPPAGLVVASANPTQQGGGVLDYSITNAGAGYTFAGMGQLIPAASDHYPQVFNW